MLRACACTLSPRSPSLLGHSLQPTPSPLCGLAPWPLLGACSMYPRPELVAGAIADALPEEPGSDKKWASAIGAEAKLRGVGGTPKRRHGHRISDKT